MRIKEALRYTTDTVNTLLAELQKPEHNEHRWGADTSKQLRGYLADALRDAAAGHTDRNQIEDLHRQADLLADPKQHVVVRDGAVRPAKFTDRHILKAVNDLYSLNRRMLPPVTGNDEDGIVSFWRHLGETGEHPYGTFSVVTPRGAWDDNHTGQYTVPASEVGAIVANDEIRPKFKSGRMRRLWNPEDIELFKGRFAETKKAVANAPYEEVDTEHPSERPQ